MQSWPTHILRYSSHLVLARALLAFAATWACVDAHALEWQVDITPAGELFPALQLSQAPRAGTAGDGLVSVRVHGADIPADLRVRIETPGLREPAVAQATGSHGDAGLELRPRLHWDIAQLRRLGGPRRQAMQVTLEAGGRAIEVRRVQVRLHPLDDALYYVREGRDRVDLDWAFAGYVNPHDPVVDDVLAAARTFDPVIDTGTPNREADTDLRQAAAVWAALEQRGLRYADGDPALSRGPTVWSQRVRLLGEVWRDRRANCIDSSILIAAVLERLGLRPFIILVPGHAFVGFGGDARLGTAQYLETTLLGARSSTKMNFAAARRAGQARWRSVAATFRGRHGPAYALIDIGTARAYGIIPLAADADAVTSGSR
ncbi:MAG: hypothetical protein ABIW82_03780 [Dokdonella sp.]